MSENDILNPEDQKINNKSKYFAPFGKEEWEQLTTLYKGEMRTYCTQNYCRFCWEKDFSSSFISEQGISIIYDFYSQSHVNYGFLILAVFASLALVCILAFIARLQPDNFKYSNALEQLTAYECGFAPFGNTNKPQLFLFYKLSVFFIIFEAELIFLYPWAVTVISYANNSIFFMSSFPFFMVLIFGFFFEIDQEALDFLLNNE